MGLFSRDKREDSEREITEYLSNRLEELAKIKKTAADVIATEVEMQRKYDECTAQVERFQELAEKAVAAGNEADARVFLKHKYELEQKQKAYEENHRQAEESARNIKLTHNAMVREINDMRTRLELMRGREAAVDAKTAFYNSGVKFDQQSYEQRERELLEREAMEEAKAYVYRADSMEEEE